MSTFFSRNFDQLFASRFRRPRTVISRRFSLPIGIIPPHSSESTQSQTFCYVKYLLLLEYKNIYLGVFLAWSGVELWKVSVRRSILVHFLIDMIQTSRLLLGHSFVLFNKSFLNCTTKSDFRDIFEYRNLPFTLFGALQKCASFCHLNALLIPLIVYTFFLWSHVWI